MLFTRYTAQVPNSLTQSLRNIRRECRDDFTTRIKALRAKIIFETIKKKKSYKNVAGIKFITRWVKKINEIYLPVF